MAMGMAMGMPKGGGGMPAVVGDERRVVSLSRLEDT